MDKNERLSVFLMVVLLAFAVVLVDERLLRTGLAVLPALMLAQKALGVGRPAPAAPTVAPSDERRRDEETRGHVEQLLKHFREFYTTCHLMSVNVLTVEAAEERVNNLERELNQLLGRITETARARGVQEKA
ncbi:MAG TPA: hypothetical protein VLH75_19325 [Longimicrobiales bacterium]|nr:hypothetical protein [Longimicrobiales bacterium]